MQPKHSHETFSTTDAVWILSYKSNEFCRSGRPLLILKVKIDQNKGVTPSWLEYSSLWLNWSEVKVLCQPIKLNLML